MLEDPQKTNDSPLEMPSGHVDDLQHVVTTLKQEVAKLRAENKALLDEKASARQFSASRAAPSQPTLRNWLNIIPIGQNPEKNHDALAETNETLSRTLQELQSTQQTLELTNDELERRVEDRSKDLIRAEQRWRSLLEEVHLVVIGLDCDGRVNYANPFFLRLTGYSLEEVLQRYWFEVFVHPKDSQHTYGYFRQLINDGALPLRYQNAIVTSTGSERMIAWNNVVLRDRTDTIIGTMSIGEDVTERLAVDRMKGEFISVISHELRTPLTAIHGGIQMIAGGLIPSESAQGQKLLQLAAANSQRLVRLVNDILDLERLESGQEILKKNVFNSQILTSQVADIFTTMAKEKGKEKGIVLEVSDPGIDMKADCDRLVQVLTHLLDNAIKFSPENGTIWLSVGLDGDVADKALAHGDGTNQDVTTVRFKVRDEGKGIPVEDLSEIFERFTQVNSSDSREKGGTGLGLAICHNIINQHNGKIWVESSFGKGSCFQFTIPLGVKDCSLLRR